MKLINDLYDYDNFKIVQDNNVFKFSLDSILLAEFVDNVDNSKIILDLCTGNCAIPLILSYYYKNKIVAFEIQDYIAELAKESIQLNNLQEQIQFIHDDIKNISHYFPGNNFDIIVANPPYFKVKDTSLLNENINKAVARHELNLNLEAMFKIVKYSLKENGIFYLVHLPERLEEILGLCEKYKIICKRIQFVYTSDDKDATIVLLKCVKGAHNALKVSPPLYVNQYKSYKKIFKR